MQDWGEEAEDGAVYSVSLRRQLSQRLSPRAAPGASQVRQGLEGGAPGGVEGPGGEAAPGHSRGAELRPVGKAGLTSALVKVEKSLRAAR